MPVDYSLLRPEIADHLRESEKLANQISKADVNKTTAAWGRIAHNREVFRINPKIITTHRVEDVYIKVSNFGQMLLRIYTPKHHAGPLPVLVHYHGGGWARGHVNTHDNICMQLANFSDCIVVAVDYPLAPEFKFHTIIEACFEALQWTHKNAASFGGNHKKIAVIGSSAGANLAAVMTLMARDRNLPELVAYQILVCPPTDMLNLNKPSHDAFGGYAGFVRETMLMFRDLYLEDQAEANHPYFSPLLAKDLSRLPTALVITAELDILRDDGRLYAERLKKSGVEVTEHCMLKMIHSGVFWSAAVPAIEEDVRLICEQIKKQLA